MAASLPELLDQVRELLRLKCYSLRTEEAYTYWIRGFIRFHERRHPRELGKEEIERFLGFLASERLVSASTQNQAKAALRFFYKEVLGIELPGLDDVEQATRPKKLPVVLTRDETAQVLARLEGTHQLIGKLLYGSGLRLLEACRLRVKDVDFAQRQILVRGGKGTKDRVTMLAEKLVLPLSRHLEGVKALHEQDLAEGYGAVYLLPFARECVHQALEREWGWQYVFPAVHRSNGTRSDSNRRHHVGEQGVQRAMRQAVRSANLVKPVTPHTLRHSFATHLLQDGYDIRTVQELMGHKDVKTTMIYTQVLNGGPRAVISPFDRLG
ncbi:integron integrase [Crenobacter cavernae]|uniref:Integron integrase n=1 Tax=Crenobacter cavernae TaxID=2290923 RepID=A0A345Y857_9NEIS|nr:integron integrase [Crenobacter cavernae]AXK40109.1 integron integrase [Crenobacter cavernae]